MFGEPGGTPLPKIPRNTPPPPWMIYNPWEWSFFIFHMSCLEFSFVNLEPLSLFGVGRDSRLNPVFNAIGEVRPAVPWSSFLGSSRLRSRLAWRLSRRLTRKNRIWRLLTGANECRGIWRISWSVISKAIKEKLPS